MGEIIARMGEIIARMAFPMSATGLKVRSSVISGSHS
jgi:hypothetical protein